MIQKININWENCYGIKLLKHEFLLLKNKSVSSQEKNVSLYKRNLHEKNLFIIINLIDIH